MCCEDESDGSFASEIKWDGTKLTCGSVVVKPCDPLNEIITKLWNMSCNRGIKYYSTTRLPGGSSPAVALTAASYTIPAGGDGTYEIEYNCFVTLPGAASGPFSEVHLLACKNTVEIDNEAQSMALNDYAAGHTVKSGLFHFVSQVSVVAGDVLAVYGFKAGSAIINNGVCKITKIA